MTTQTPDIKAVVREHYAEHAREFAGEAGAKGGCCSGAGTAHTVSLYGEANVIPLAEQFQGASLGCGNPLVFAGLKEGDTVLDLGSGAGLDCLLAAQRVGPTGQVIGLDMTPEMIALARQNAARMGAANVTFRQGEMEAIPLPDATVDVVISNCVINLSPDKAAVLREAWRVLRPGGRFSVADIIASRPLTEAERADLTAWSGCVVGALDADTYRALLAAAGFANITISGEAAGECCGAAGLTYSATVTAYKPA